MTGSLLCREDGRISSFVTRRWIVCAIYDASPATRVAPSFAPLHNWRFKHGGSDKLFSLCGRVVNRQASEVRTVKTVRIVFITPTDLPSHSVLHGTSGASSWWPRGLFCSRLIGGELLGILAHLVLYQSVLAHTYRSYVILFIFATRMCSQCALFVTAVHCAKAVRYKTILYVAIVTQITEQNADQESPIEPRQRTTV